MQQKKLRYPHRECLIIGVFILLTVMMLYPLSLNLTSMVPEPTDPLLNAWRMQWNVHSFLNGPSGIANLFNTNIFYPYPLTLVYSEHFLMIAAQALPFLLVADSHLLGMNLSVLVTFVLSGYGLYLLLTVWTGNRWVGLVAGILFAFSPYRFGQLNHLELLVTQWLPFALLALHWTLTRPGLRYPILFGLFFNLQALSGFHYVLNLTIACTLLALVYTLFGRVRWRWSLWGAAVATITATMLLNWPIWRMYLRFSDVMGAIRTPGEVRVYSAALTDYLTAIPYNLLYGWTFGYWQSPDHQFQPLMPVGIIGLILVILGLIPLFKKSSYPTSHILPPTITFLLTLTLISLLLSFGLNENALGPALAPVLKYSPYHWLYDNVAIFQGIRVPGRYGILAVLGLSGLAGWGAAWLSIQYSVFSSQYSVFSSQKPNGAEGRRAEDEEQPPLSTPHSPLSNLQPPLSNPQSPLSNLQSPLSNLQSPTLHSPLPTPHSPLPNLQSSLIPLLLIGAILFEYWSAPLVGPEFPAGEGELASVYSWLAQETEPDAVILELPFQGHSEFLYEYYSSHHWRRLANGGTGFTPPIYKELRQWFKHFPDPRSVDVIQQLGVDYVVLHPQSYSPEEWQRVMVELPLYLPAITQLHQEEDVLVLRVAKTVCQSDPNNIQATIAPAQLDGLADAVGVRYQNLGTTTYVADVTQVSHLTFADGAEKIFTEPLLVPAGESQTVVVPLKEPLLAENVAAAYLNSLQHEIVTNLAAPSPQPSSPISVDDKAWLPLGLQYAAGPRLLAYQLMPPNPTVCSQLTLALQWAEGHADDTATVQLLDPFGRVVAEDINTPWVDGGGADLRQLPLVGSLPAGEYGIRVFVKAAAGSERMPVTEEGVTIPTEQIPPLLLTIHPNPANSVSVDSAQPIAQFAAAVSLLDSNIAQASVLPGDWLRFSLVWQLDQPIDTELTVFTQLIGPDGQVWGQRDNQPGGGWYGVPLWPPSQPVIDHYAFQIQPDTPVGPYRLIAGLYQSDTQQRLPVNSSDFVEIGTVVVGQ